jgi:PLP dependent protein
VGEVVLIHSLDRMDLAEEIERQAEIKHLEKVDCLIQINSANEQTKSGLALEEVENFVAQHERFKKIRIRGLMTIGPLTEDQEKIRSAFRNVKKLQEHLKQKFPKIDLAILSMGMSGDYKIAIEEGANLLRIGTAVFGKRKLTL